VHDVATRYCRIFLRRVLQALVKHVEALDITTELEDGAFATVSVLDCTSSSVILERCAPATSEERSRLSFSS
jgi:hypothetical protein